MGISSYIWNRSGRRSLSALAAMLAVLGLWLVPAMAQQSAETFTIKNVSVDATAASAAQARDIAIADGERAALTRLFDSMVLKSESAFLPSLDASQIAALVDGISVSDERVSRTRYLARLTVYFKAEEIRSLLQRAGIAFSETISKPVLIMPVLQTAGFATLWDNPNPWLAGWQSYDQSDSHAPFILPKGDAEEAASLSASDVITGNPDTVAKLEKAYGVTDIYLAYADLHPDAYGAEEELRVVIMRFGENPAVLGDDILHPDPGLPPEQRVTAMLDTAVAEAVSEMQEAWKRQTQVIFGAEVSLSAVVPVTTLADWVRVKQKLERSPVVRAIDVESMTVHETRIAIKYLGNTQQLALALAQSDLQLEQSPAGDWTITSIGAHASR